MIATVICAVLAMHDGDSGHCNGRPFRLQGIDAPETAPFSRCRSQPGIWACSPAARSYGFLATRRARQLAVEGAECLETEERPSHGRRIFRCSVHGHDLGAALVSEGLAISEKQFGDRYADEQAGARAHHRGAWNEER
jgi:endonuclease YncB( thermonuclease family)